nr:MAG TPA: antirestriction protein [Caudoviricetes sp.]
MPNDNIPAPTEPNINPNPTLINAKDVNNAIILIFIPHLLSIHQLCQEGVQFPRCKGCTHQNAYLLQLHTFHV